jgi:hypothetical protein
MLIVKVYEEQDASTDSVSISVVLIAQDKDGIHKYGIMPDGSSVEVGEGNIPPVFAKQSITKELMETFGGVKVLHYKKTFHTEKIVPQEEK